MKTWKTVGTLLSVLIVGFMMQEVAAQSSFSVTYNFSNVVINVGGTTDPTPPPTAGGVDFGSFAAVGYSGNPNASGRFAWNGNPTGGLDGVDDFTQFGGSLSTTAYFEVSINPSPLGLIELQLDSIGFTVQRSGQGPRSYAVRSSVDGYAANLPASINPANANLGVGPGDELRILLDTVTTAQNGSLITLGLPHASLTSPVTFRFYAWNAETTTGTFSIDNVTISGSTRNIPEPTTGTLLVLGLAACSFARRRHA
jgi:trimeric autotransporter adhesin